MICHYNYYYDDDDDDDDDDDYYYYYCYHWTEDDDDEEAARPTRGSQASALRRISAAAAVATSVLALAATAAALRRMGSPADSARLADKVLYAASGPMGTYPIQDIPGGCGCSWLPTDNCLDQNGCAIACRAQNPSWGARCTIATGAAAPTAPPTAQPTAPPTALPTAPPTEPPTPMLRQSPPNVVVVRSLPNCNCDWIQTDNCVGQDDCARGCRLANPWGPCATR